jgi:hypothetical protein
MLKRRREDEGEQDDHGAEGHEPKEQAKEPGKEGGGILRHDLPVCLLPNVFFRSFRRALTFCLPQPARCLEWRFPRSNPRTMCLW